MDFLCSDNGSAVCGNRFLPLSCTVRYLGAMSWCLQPSLKYDRKKTEGKEGGSEGGREDAGGKGKEEGKQEQSKCQSLTADESR